MISLLHICFLLISCVVVWILKVPQKPSCRGFRITRMLFCGVFFYCFTLGGGEERKEECLPWGRGLQCGWGHHPLFSLWRLSEITSFPPSCASAMRHCLAKDPKQNGHGLKSLKNTIACYLSVQIFLFVYRCKTKEFLISLFLSIVSSICVSFISVVIFITFFLLII